MFPLKHEAFDIAPQRAQPLSCIQSPWDGGFSRALTVPDLLVTTSASFGTTPLLLGCNYQLFALLFSTMLWGKLAHQSVPIKCWQELFLRSVSEVSSDPRRALLSSVSGSLCALASL